jgi:hypothetical protein
MGHLPYLAPPAGRRRRPVALACLFAATALGLLSRRCPLPGLFAEYTGDGLYTVAVFFALAVVAPAATTLALSAGAFGFSAGIECLQLLPWPWLADLRATAFGALVLGQGFQWQDLLAYGLGAALAGGVDRAWIRRR